MYDLLIPILVFVAVVATGAALVVLRAGRQRKLRRRLRDEDTAADDQSGRPRIVGALEQIGDRVAPKSPSTSLRQYLASAGYHGSHAAGIYLGSKIVLLLAGGLGVGLLLLPLEATVANKLLGSMGAAAVLFFLPNIFVQQRRTQRRLDVRSHLPDALDLLEICVSAGMGLDAAWNAVTDEIRDVSVILADEMALTNLEIHLGAKRAAALRHMADRTGAEEIASLVGVLVQSERFGTSIAEALRTFAKSMREARSYRAEVDAEKMAVKLLFPMILFIFPTILIVTVGPASIILYDIMGGGK